MKLVELEGTHYEVGYDYAALLGKSRVNQAHKSSKHTKFS